MDWVSRTDLMEPRRLKELSKRSDAKGLVQLASHMGAMGATGAGLWLTWGTWWGVPLFIVHGYLINCLFATQHECNHQTAFQSRWLNDAVRRFSGLAQFYPSWWEAWFHFTHHRHTGDWAKDTELLVRKKYTLAIYLYFLLGIGYWHFRLRHLLRAAWGILTPEPFWLSEKQRRYAIWEARGHVAFYAALAAASVAFQTSAVVILWLAPMLATKSLHQLQNLGEHLGLEDGGTDTTKNTRTLAVPGFVRWALWQMPYHAAHHTFPGVPFHNLPTLHKELEAKLGRPLPTAGYFETTRAAIRAMRKGPEGTWALPFGAGGSRPAGAPRPAAAE
jgi:fatty acid desaturase